MELFVDGLISQRMISATDLLCNSGRRNGKMEYRFARFDCRHSRHSEDEPFAGSDNLVLMFSKNAEICGKYLSLPDGFAGDDVKLEDAAAFCANPFGTANLRAEWWFAWRAGKHLQVHQYVKRAFQPEINDSGFNFPDFAGLKNDRRNTVFDCSSPEGSLSPAIMYDQGDSEGAGQP